MALTLRRTWPDRPHPKEDWLVLDDGIEVGQIEKNDTAAGEPRWEWALTGATWCAYQHGIRGSGVAPNLDAAKTAWREAYERWLNRKADIASKHR